MPEFTQYSKAMYKAETQDDQISTHQTDLSNPMATELRLRSILPGTDPVNIGIGAAGGYSDPIIFGTPVWVVMEHLEEPRMTYCSNFRGLFFSLEAATKCLKKLIRAAYPPKGYKVPTNTYGTPRWLTSTILLNFRSVLDIDADWDMRIGHGRYGFNRSSGEGGRCQIRRWQAMQNMRRHLLEPGALLGTCASNLWRIISNNKRSWIQAA